MRTRTTLIPIAVAAALGLNTTAGATTGTCTLTAQPQDERSYHLAYTDRDGDMHILINRQDATPLKPTSWQIPADFDTVLWATKRGVIDGPGSFYDHLVNAGGCQFSEPYHAAPGWRASIIIGPGTPAPTTTSSTVPPSTTTSAPPPTAPPTTVVTVTVPPVPVTRVTELPPATFPPTWPEQPSTTLPQGLDLVGLIPSPTPYTAVQPPTTLPATGASSGGLALFGLALLIPGALLAGLARLRNRHQHGRNFTAS